mmetsp:Transcript_105553/g.183557  ORF Transcript_105553/g.183557 Transcript_105553/m.183557 type:complete len:272 (+) Transcript_105553:780-1595(+)
MTLYQSPDISACVTGTSGLGGSGASNGPSAPGSMIEILMHFSFSIVHCSKLSKSWFSYRAKQPTSHFASPKHLAMHKSPLVQSPLSAHDVVAILHWFTRHFVSTSSDVDFEVASALSSFSACAELTPTEASDKEISTVSKRLFSAPKFKASNGGRLLSLSKWLLCMSARSGANIEFANMLLNIELCFTCVPSFRVKIGECGAATVPRQRPGLTTCHPAPGSDSRHSIIKALPWVHPLCLYSAPTWRGLLGSLSAKRSGRRPVLHILDEVWH